MCGSLAFAAAFFVVFILLTASRVSGIPFPKVRPSVFSLGIFIGLGLLLGVLVVADWRLTTCAPNAVPTTAAGAVAPAPTPPTAPVATLTPTVPAPVVGPEVQVVSADVAQNSVPIESPPDDGPGIVDRIQGIIGNIFALLVIVGIGWLLWKGVSKHHHR